MSGNVNQNEGIILPAEQCAVNRTAGDEKAESSYVRVQAIGKGQYRAIIGAPEIQPDTAEEKRAPTVCAADAKEVSFTSPTGETVRWSFDGAKVIREKDLFPGVDMKAEVSKVAYKETLLFNHPDAVRRLSQTLCKPPNWCRIRAPEWRFSNGKEERKAAQPGRSGAAGEDPRTAGTQRS